MFNRPIVLITLIIVKIRINTDYIYLITHYYCNICIAIGWRQYYELTMSAREHLTREHLKGYIHLIVGPYHSGKTFYLKNQVKADLYFDLADADTYRKLSLQPEFLTKLTTANLASLSIDNIHLLPQLLGVIEALFFKYKLTVYLSTNILEPLSVKISENLQPYIHVHELTPPSYYKTFSQLDLDDFLKYGLLYSTHNSTKKELHLDECAGEILKDLGTSGLIKKVDNFSRFLHHAAECVGHDLNYQHFSKVINVPSRTIQEYFRLLESVGLGYIIKSTKSTPLSKSCYRFYFFDSGISNAFKNNYEVLSNSEDYLLSLQQFLFLELKKAQLNSKAINNISFWSDYKNNSLDFIINDSVAVSIVPTKNIHFGHVTSLKKKIKLAQIKKAYLISFDDKQSLLSNLSSDSVQHFTYIDFLKKIAKADAL